MTPWSRSTREEKKRKKKNSDNKEKEKNKREIERNKEQPPERDTEYTYSWRRSNLRSSALLLLKITILRSRFTM